MVQERRPYGHAFTAQMHEYGFGVDHCRSAARARGGRGRSDSLITRRDDVRLNDIDVAIAAIESYAGITVQPTSV